MGLNFFYLVSDAAASLYFCMLASEMGILVNLSALERLLISYGTEACLFFRLKGGEDLPDVLLIGF